MVIKKDKRAHKYSLCAQLRDRRGWVKLVEAFLSVLLMGIILAIIVNQQVPLRDNFSSSISSYEVYMLRNIELNETLRAEVLGVSAEFLPINWSSGTFPAVLKNKIISLTPGFLSCEAKICTTGDACNFAGEIDTDIYAQRIFIASTYGSYNPRQLKLFCWRK